MQKITILGIVIAMIVSYGCNNKKQLTAIVQTVNASDGLPVPSANVVLTSKADSIYLKDGSTHSVAGVTDGSGKWTLEFKLESIVPVHAWKYTVVTAMAVVDSTPKTWSYTVTNGVKIDSTVSAWNYITKTSQILDSLVGNGTIRFDPQQKEKHRIDNAIIKMYNTFHKVIPL